MKGIKIKIENNRSCEMVTFVQEINGFSITIGTVKDSIRRESLHWPATHLDTAEIQTCNI